MKNVMKKEQRNAPRSENVFAKKDLKDFIVTAAQEKFKISLRKFSKILGLDCIFF